ncbi:MAG: SpoIID/LytB domain-containing protein [Bacteroidales bacterium]|nr:SpoIID/LytB domain-containing protein [Bacteroidales bacterium]
MCDARFSKCCGGSSELFRTCWSSEDKPYLRALPDTPGHNPDGKPFCDTSDRTILDQVLNDYDIESDDFYRWVARIPKPALSELVMRKSGVALGEIKRLVPLETGPSGRIWKLRIEGSVKSLVVGKELEIRRLLSESHLRSSVFTPRFEGDELVLEGRGWGHGVGLCQIGAAVMASEGYGYREILEHYYPGSEIKDEK